MGRIATILFAHKLGTSLEPECKMYRLAADVFNDTAMVLDCLSPALPKLPRVVLLSFSSVLRALCGVAAGSSKASLSAHFAKWGNLGELNAVGSWALVNVVTVPFWDTDVEESLSPEAYILTERQKDSSQETIISLMGMLAGSLVVSYVSSPMATWSCLVLLLSIHLAMNHAAVKAVSMHTLNRQRANIVLSTFLERGEALTPEHVSKQERIFEWDGALRWEGSPILARANIGVSLQSLLNSMTPGHSVTGSIRNASIDIGKLAEVYRMEEYMLWFDSRRRAASIVLKEGASPTSQLKAWTQALWIAHRHDHRDATSAGSTDEGTLQLLRRTLEELTSCWDGCLESLRGAGWDLGIASLETTSATRVRVRPASKAAS
ncbi:hypothetical protein MMC24_006714 [Lignoscripta atroalba]|nr:hypothetical protein [Lignoscripta atroalba]